MRLSNYFLPVLKENPKRAQIVSHRLMLRAGMIQQSSAGIYSWLPLGLKVLSKIEQIVREEQNRSGAHEIKMPTIQPAELWQNPAAMMITGWKCCALKIAMTAICSTGLLMKNRSPIFAEATSKATVPCR